MNNLEYYIKAFSKLHVDKGKNKYSALTKYCAPHKPLLLLSVIDLIEEGIIENNLIELSPELGETFSQYWLIVNDMDRKGKIVYPFFHLRREGFWKLIPRPGKEEILKNTKEISSVYRLTEIILGAKFRKDLFILLNNSKGRNSLRLVLIDNYFDEIIKEKLIEQSKINIESYKYSLELLKKNLKVKEYLITHDSYKEKVRDQGFRKAVVTAYEHRCSICGIRMRTPDGHTVVDGAHIIPWSVSKDDSPQNGIALCKLCHWTFDEGLIGILTNYSIILSDKLKLDENIAGHLSTFDKREIYKPQENYLWPSKKSLQYHLSNIFRKEL